MRTIQVEPSELEACASRMNQSNQNYEQYIHDLFASVDLMQSVWKGKDNLAFTSEIQKFEGVFRQLSVLCKQYENFLSTSAKSYRETQDELISQVNRLISG